MGEPSYLTSLNEAQFAAVTHDPTIPLQILAGPGSGKTRTLISRIAYIIDNGVPPSKIVAVTFTNKAANELRVRLEALMGARAASALHLGTFHAICGRLLRQHGAKIKVPNNFTILDADESKKLISTILKDTIAASGAHASGGKKPDLKDGLVVELISKIKAKGLSPEEFEAQTLRQAQSQQKPSKGEIDPFLAQHISPIYTKYAEDCQRNNALDFDDLLMYGVKLLEEKNDCIDCQHIFVDEFQDTNAIQLRLMSLFAKKQRNVSVVGDPDQSIYGWRSAEIENLSRMIALFPETKQIFLEDNYRSTGAILAASVAIISEDTARPPKTLRTSHPAGAPVTLGNCADEHEEALCIAEEIKRLKMTSGGLLKWSDFAILLRFNALSRNLETALQKEGIPSKVLAGQKFFDRVEVKDLIAYLQLIDNPNFDQAAYRILNVPKRNIGEKTVHELRLRANKLKKPVMYVIEKIVEGRIPDISPPLKPKAKPFIQSMRNLRELALMAVPMPELIEGILKELKYADHLHKSYTDWETRWENIRELITFATDVAPVPTLSTEVPSADGEGIAAADGENPLLNSSAIGGNATTTEPKTDAADITAPEIIDLTQDDQDEVVLDQDEEVVPDQAEVVTPLRIFLQNTSLATDTLVKSDESKTERVTISTCHAAKGLEWPVVFIPSVEEGTFPFYRTDDTEEERRLLYVACTRAQVLLYLTATTKRKLGGEDRDQKLSSFLDDVIAKDKKNTLFTDKKPILNHSAFRLISKVLSRDCPEPDQVEQGEQEYYKAKPSTSTSTPVVQPIKPSVTPKEVAAQPSSSQDKPKSKNFRFKSTTGSASQAGGSHAAIFSTARVVAASLSQDQNAITSITAATSTTIASSQGGFKNISSTSVSTAGTSTGLREKPKSTASNQPITSFYKPQSIAPTQNEVTVSTSSAGSAMPVSVPMFLPAQMFQSATGQQPPPKVAGTKRRLGMSSSGTEYPRKK